MKYMVLTSKHHDGFAMFKSDADPFNIVDATPFKRDVVKELAAACKKYGMKLGLYYSQAQDWTAPGGSAIGGAIGKNTNSYSNVSNSSNGNVSIGNYGANVDANSSGNASQTASASGPKLSASGAAAQSSASGAAGLKTVQTVNSSKKH